MRRSKCQYGWTFFEPLIVVGILVLLLAILLPGLHRARRAARRMECAGRMRQIGLALFQYEKHYRFMPNAQWNTFRQIRLYLGIDKVSVGKPKVTEVFRCPSDEYLSDDDLWNAVSYAPLVDSGFYDGDGDGKPDGNIKYCAWSYCRTGLDVDNDGRRDKEDRIWFRRRLPQIAPDTVILAEFWAATNRLDLGKEYPAGLPAVQLVEGSG